MGNFLNEILRPAAVRLGYVASGAVVASGGTEELAAQVAAGVSGLALLLADIAWKRVATKRSRG